MDKLEKDKLGKLLGREYIERNAKRQTVKGRNGEEIPIVETEKVTGLDGQGGIVDGEIDRIKEYGCGCPAHGRENYGGKCKLCGATFCNTLETPKRHLHFRACYRCKEYICMRCVKGREGERIYCSEECKKKDRPSLIPLIICIIIGAIFALYLILKWTHH